MVSKLSWLASSTKVNHIALETRARMTSELNPDVLSSMKPASLPNESAQCPVCGAQNQPLEQKCVGCGMALPPAPKMFDTPSTLPMRRQPQTVPIERDSPSRFPPQATVLFQFLPSAVCRTVEVHEPLILGRTSSESAERILDLTDLNALAHGVSRRHCLLQRRGEYLSVTDLGSVNGTFLNDQKLMPFVDYVVSHGDHLILGTLHVAVFFGGMDTTD